MKRIFTILLLLIVYSSWTMSHSLFELEQHIITKSNEKKFNFEILSKDELFETKKSEKTFHILRLQSVNPEVDLKLVNNEFDFSSLNFIHDPSETVAYRLYTGGYLIVSLKTEFISSK